jgi:hypothetical protein
MRTRGLRVFSSMTLLIALAISCTKGSSAAPPTSSSPPVPLGPPSAVVGLKAAQPHRWNADPKTWKVTLSWRAPVSGAPADHYQVARDGRIIQRSVSATTFQDDRAEPGTGYRYEVRAIAADGGTGKPAKAAIKTREPALTDARLEGHYDTRFTPTSSNVGATHVLPVVVVFTPKCGHGACDVGYERVGTDGSGTLQRSGINYAGTVSAPFDIRSCHGSTINETLSFAVVVTRAAVVHGEWRASAYTGTLTESAPASGCITGVTHWTLAGKTE